MAWESEALMSKGRRLMAQLERKRKILLFFQLSVLFAFYKDWMIPTSVDEGGIFTQSTETNANLFQKHFHRSLRNNV